MKTFTFTILLILSSQLLSSEPENIDGTTIVRSVNNTLETEEDVENQFVLLTLDEQLEFYDQALVITNYDNYSLEETDMPPLKEMGQYAISYARNSLDQISREKRVIINALLDSLDQEVIELEQYTSNVHLHLFLKLALILENKFNEDEKSPMITADLRRLTQIGSLTQDFSTSLAHAMKLMINSPLTQKDMSSMNRFSTEFGLAKEGDDDFAKQLFIVSATEKLPFLLCLSEGECDFLHMMRIYIKYGFYPSFLPTEHTPGPHGGIHPNPFDFFVHDRGHTFTNMSSSDYPAMDILLTVLAKEEQELTTSDRALVLDYYLRTHEGSDFPYEKIELAEKSDVPLAIHGFFEDDFDTLRLTTWVLQDTITTNHGIFPRTYEEKELYYEQFYAELIDRMQKIKSMLPAGLLQSIEGDDIPSLVWRNIE